MPKNNFCYTEIIFLEFLLYNNYNRKKLKFFRKVAVDTGAGRPKLEFSRLKQVNIRLTENEFAELEKICEKLKITKTEAILRGIKLLKNPPRQIITRSQLPGFVPKKIQNSPGIVADDD